MAALVASLFTVVLAGPGCSKQEAPADKSVAAKPAVAKPAATPASKPGWKTAITAENTGVAADKLHLQGAPDPIAGHTLEQIVKDPNVQVRGDATCGSCHGWVEDATRELFCSKIDVFCETDQDGSGPKPQVLKDVLLDWKKRGCPK